MATRSIQPGIVKALSGSLHKSNPATVRHTQNPAALPFTGAGKGGNSMPTGHVTNDAQAPKAGKAGNDSGSGMTRGGVSSVPMPFTK